MKWMLVWNGGDDYLEAVMHRWDRVNHYGEMFNESPHRMMHLTTYELEQMFAQKEVARV